MQINLKNATVRALDFGVPEEEGSATIVLKFSDGTRIKTAYWRIITNGKAAFSCFDHMKKYGLPEFIDAKSRIIEILNDRECLAASIRKETADIIIDFSSDIRMEIFNFTSYEIWEISLPDGTVEYSNYALVD